VRAYASGDESHTVVAGRFSLNPWTLLRWILVRRRDAPGFAMAAEGTDIAAQTWPRCKAPMLEVYRGRDFRAVRSFWFGVNSGLVGFRESLSD
jgi:hypothetical protein